MTPSPMDPGRSLRSPRMRLSTQVLVMFGCIAAVGYALAVAGGGW